MKFLIPCIAVACFALAGVGCKATCCGTCGGAGHGHSHGAADGACCGKDGKCCKPAAAPVE